MREKGLFIKVEVFGIPVDALLDTGSTLSVISPRVFEKISDENKPKIAPVESNLRMANGDTSTPQGKACFKLVIDATEFWPHLTISDIEVPMIIGYDFMYAHHCSLDVRNSRLKIGRQYVKCHQEGQTSSLFRIRLDRNVTVPPGAEMIIGGKIDLNGQSLRETSEMIIEPKPESVLTKQGILVAKALINPHSERIPLRVMNLTDEPQPLHTQTIAATAENVESVTLLQTDAPSCPLMSVQSVSRDLDLEKMPAHIKSVWEANATSLTEEQKKPFFDLLMKHQNVFAKSKYDLGHTTIVRHEIFTGDHPPIKQAPRRMPLTKREVVQKEVQSMLQNGIIEPSTSPWSSPIVLVEKKDHSTRFCVDYRALNEITRKDSYPLPNIQDCFDAFGGTSWFSSIDLQSGYWQVGMSSADAPKTAFTCSEGLFQFKVLPFGCCNGPPTFQRLMDYVLAGLRWKICLLYLDDVIVFSKTFEDHVEQLSQVLSRISEAGLKVAPKKCHFFQSEVTFLGHIVSRDGVATDPSKTQCIADWPQPKNVKEVRQFTGLCAYYRRYVKNFSQIARPLHKLTEKDSPFLWTEECSKAFKELKRLLTSSPILAYPILGLEYFLDSDASAEALGSILSQIQDGHERVIGYYSRSFNKQERNYCVTRKELLSIVDSVKHFHQYLYGSKCTVRTDHGSLAWLMRFSNPESQLARWLETLSLYDLTIKYRPGRLNSNADAMSRIPCDWCNHCTRQEALSAQRSAKKTVTKDSCRKMTLRSHTQAVAEDDSLEKTPQGSAWITMKTPQDLRNGQLNDPTIRVVLGWKESDHKPKWDEISHLGSEPKHYWSQWDRLKLINGVLYREWYETQGGPSTLQFVLPEVWRAEIMTLLHDNICSGHMGIHRTIARVRARFYWVGFKEDIVTKCNTCHACQARNMPTKPTKAPLKPYTVGVPMERVQMDIIGPLPETRLGNKYVLTITCCFTKWTESYPLKNITAEAVASTFVKEFICRYGLVKEIHSDQGRQFESQLFKEMCDLLGIDKTRTTAFYPASDGLVERVQRTIEDMLSKYIKSSQRDWDEILPFVLMAYRSSKQEATKKTPNLMFLGREIDLPVDLLYPSPPVDPESPKDEYVVKLQNKLKKVHEMARNSLLEAGQRQKLAYDRRVNKHAYKVGDAVWLRSYIKPKGLARKLQLRWEGPFKVVGKISDLTYKVQKSRKADFKVVHFNRLKPYRGNLSSWFTCGTS